MTTSRSGSSLPDRPGDVSEPQPKTAGGDGSGAGEPTAPPVPKTRYDLRILQALRRVFRAVELHSRRLAVDHEITGPQLLCLLTIADATSITATEIAKRVHVSPSTVVGILDRLEEKGLVARNRDRADRRLVHVSVTEKGRALAVRAPSPLQDRLVTALQRLPESEQTTIALSLERIVDLMEARRIDAAPLLAAEAIESAVSGDSHRFPAGNR